MASENKQMPLSEVGKIFLRQKENLGYSNSSMAKYRKYIADLSAYMQEKGNEFYTVAVGEGFLCSPYCNKTPHSHELARTFIAQFDDCLVDGTIKPCHSRKEVTATPECFSEIESKYVSWCREKGNGPVTLGHKHHAFARFFDFIKRLGCQEIGHLTPSHITKAVLNEKCADNHRYFREILRFLASEGILQYDYSALVPVTRKGFHLPSTYNREERKLLEKAPDRNTAMGKRDYAVILLANRLGIRSGDIAGLTFGDIDFEHDTIRFKQEKTNSFQELCLVPDVKEALTDYIENGRPHSGNERVLLGCRAPHRPIDSASIYCIISKGFREAGIDTSCKKHGGHSLRASLATDMVNTGESYEQTRKILGHGSPDVIKHYAKLDIERLRLCALEGRRPTGFFERFLNGEEVVV